MILGVVFPEYNYTFKTKTTSLFSFLDIVISQELFMARYFVYCFIFNLACCFALPQIGDRLGKQVNYSIVILGHCHPSRMSRL